MKNLTDQQVEFAGLYDKSGNRWSEMAPSGPTQEFCPDDVKQLQQAFTSGPGKLQTEGLKCQNGNKYSFIRADDDFVVLKGKENVSDRSLVCFSTKQCLVVAYKSGSNTAGALTSQVGKLAGQLGDTGY